MTVILAIDPGPEQSAVVVWDTYTKTVLYRAYSLNPTLFENVLLQLPDIKVDISLVESIHYYHNMHAGESTFTTCIWIGRFLERACVNYPEVELHLISRPQVCQYHCGGNAKKAAVNQVLRDKYGKPGGSKHPGVTYGITDHIWDAFALATYWSEEKLGISPLLAPMTLSSINNPPKQAQGAVS